MFYTLVSKVGVGRKLPLDCFHSLFRNNEDTTVKRSANWYLIFLDVKKEMSTPSFALRRISPLPFWVFPRVHSFHHEVLLVIRLKVRNPSEVLHLCIFRDTSETLTLATIRYFCWHSFTWLSRRWITYLVLKHSSEDKAFSVNISLNWTAMVTASYTVFLILLLTFLRQNLAEVFFFFCFLAFAFAF